MLHKEVADGKNTGESNHALQRPLPWSDRCMDILRGRRVRPIGGHEAVAELQRWARKVI